jgi:hypothetical protein
VVTPESERAGRPAVTLETDAFVVVAPWSDAHETCPPRAVRPAGAGYAGAAYGSPQPGNAYPPEHQADQAA